MIPLHLQLINFTPPTLTTRTLRGLVHIRNNWVRSGLNGPVNLDVKKKGESYIASQVWFPFHSPAAYMLLHQLKDRWLNVER